MNRTTIVLVLLSLHAGCMSVSSTLLERDISNLGWVKNNLKGVPVTLRVPTHIRVDVFRREYVNLNGNAELLSISDSNIPYSSTNFVTTLVETEKVFTVDLPRPASGGLAYEAKFRDRYIDSIRSSANDDTIIQSSLALRRLMTNIATGQTVAAQTVVSTSSSDFLQETPNANTKDRGPIAGPLPILTAAAENTEPSGPFEEHSTISVNGQTYSQTRNLVCSRLFNLDDADVEQQICQFMNRYTCH